MLSDLTAQEGAYADVTVKMGLVKLLTKTFDICDEACVNNSTFPALLLTLIRINV